MADVQHLKNKGIPLKVDGSIRYVRGATKYTTCGDVIKMVLKKTGVKKEYRHLFAIYEVSFDAEKALPCKSRIVKVVESWRGEPNKLVLRKSEPLTPVLLDEKKHKWNLKTKSRQQKPETRKLPDLQTLTSLSDMVDRHRGQMRKGSCSDDSSVERFVDSTSDSDSSMDELLSKLDHSKIAGLLNFFAAMAAKKYRRNSYRRSNSGSTHESADSSDSSPVRPRRRKIKSSRQSLAKKTTKSRNCRSRMRASADMHPNKMHAVKRVNFGFIDVEPRSQDRVYSLSDVRTAEEETTTTRPQSTRIFSARRRLIPGKRSSYKVIEDNSDKGIPTFRRTISDDSSYSLTGPYKVRRVSEKCKEDWCGSPIPLVDSGHEEDSDSSTDLDTAFVRRNNVFDVTRARQYMETPEHGRIFPYIVNEKPVTSSTRKLVEYSITDDELDTSDIINITETSETEDEDNDDSENLFSINRICINSCSVQTENCKLKDCTKESNTEKCAKSVKNHQESDKNVTDFIKSIFGKEVKNEDEEMNSFMKSMVLDESSDEGLSSMGSDLEKDERIRL
ncbi:uncharacterized protein LOC123536949 [Mercenaria mercenaria]|uniref:uncharacterized protein LOC123536949 n=1 Tax=Mercenaria mercenaria TaxID=6596 RepID=UPI00234F52BE|nr:uncharacterized protein LOC123536949 [Mercenaria mercenaria]